MRALVLAAALAAPHVQQVGTFREPVYVTGAGHRVLVAERRGRIRDLRTGRTVAKLPVVVPKGPENVDQRGLFSIAWRRGRLYADYVGRDGHLRVDEVQRRTIIDLGPVGLQHHGGQLQFGPDGKLYVSTGIGDDPNASGKILRVDPRGGAPEVYATGLRNPWRFSFHGRTLIIGDVGDMRAEEIDIATGPGANFGWPFMEGTMVRSPPPAGLTPPALVRPHPSACAIVGGYVWHGRYVYGDLCSGKLRSARLEGTALVDDRPLGVTVGYLASFGKDSAGRLYAVSFGGTVYRLTEP